MHGQKQNDHVRGSPILGLRHGVLKVSLSTRGTGREVLCRGKSEVFRFLKYPQGQIAPQARTILHEL